MFTRAEATLEVVAWTYLLECSDGSYYVGSTTSLEPRVAEHNLGLGAAYTRTRLPVTLLWAAEFEKIEEAYSFERKVHGWSRAKKAALARGEFDHLPVLSSRSYQGRSARDEAQRADRALRDGPPDGPPQGPDRWGP